MRKFLASLASLLLLVAILLSIVDVLCFAKGFYTYEYRKGNQAEKIGMSEEGLMDATVTLLDYLKDKRDDIIVETEVNGELREVYDSRETLHMVDVKNLYQNAMKARTIFAIGAIAIALGLYFTKKKGFWGLMRQGYRNALLLMVLFVSFIAIWCIVDFNAFWMNFHYVFFDNDLFLLNPNVSIMINMLPESFFFDIVAAIIIVFAICIGLCAYGLRFAAKKEMAQ